MTEKYDFQAIEKKWRELWESLDLYKTKTDPDKEKYYYLDMFPYPSGELHMGHMRNYIIGDVVSRYKVMNGFNVLHPMGFDSFGLPAEGAAIKNGIHPAKWTMNCIARMKKQFSKLGISFDWSREVITCLPEYYKWNQWFFLKIMEMGLAYRKNAPVNWCPNCETVLAKEEVEGGQCWRCGGPSTRKDMEQWFFRITNYADRLLDDLEKLDNWPERVRLMQRNWIGRSNGAIINFKIHETGDEVPVFTTRPDTIYGVTYLVLAPEHPLVKRLTNGTEFESQVNEFIEQVRSMTDIERQSAAIEKTGMFIGKHAVNPINGDVVPVWITNYVLLDYGTGAVMGVPAHDERDFEFAKKYGLDIRVVIAPSAEDVLDPSKMDGAYEGAGVQVNSGPFDGMPTEESKQAIIKYLEERGIGGAKTTYRLRDWLISRQRYWGTPIPIIYCDKCGIVPVPYEDLPVRLPTDVEFTGKGESPLTTSQEFMSTKCPKCGAMARRETDTMATWIDSSWYFLRYTSPKEENAPFDTEAANYWLPVDQYVGGIEHAVLHLLYSRFFTKVIKDMGLINFDEPFTRLFTQGMIYKDGYKMSKSRGNVVSPDYICERYGADTGRMFILFIGPPDQDAEWNDQGIEGVFRFLNRLWRFYDANIELFSPEWRKSIDTVELTSQDRAMRRKTHQTIKKLTSDIERFHFNTAVSAFMEMMNELSAFRENGFSADKASSIAVLSEAMETLALTLSPFVPHIADELWSRLGKPGFTYTSSWPVFDEEIARDEEITIVIQINGKVRERIQAPIGLSIEELKQIALNNEHIKDSLKDKQVKKVIAVPNKLVNIVV